MTIMKKLNKLFAILFAVLGINAAAKAYTTADLTAAGWTKVESITDVAKYYYVFVDAGSSNYAMAHVPENGRGCYKTLADPTNNMGFVWILETAGEAYSLKNADSNWYFNSGNAGWNNSMGATNDNANYKFAVTAGKYSITSVTVNQLLGPWNNNGAVANDGENVAANKSVSQAPGFYIYSMLRSEFYSFLSSTFSSATKANPVDATFLIHNSDFSYKSSWGWTLSGSSGNRQYGNATMEAWNNSNFEMNQQLCNLPNGIYTVTVDVISGPNNPLNAYLYAIGASEVTSKKVSAVASADDYTTMSNEVKGKTLTAANVLVTDGTLKIGVKDPQGWIVIDNFTLSYLGIDLTALRNALDEKITEAEAIDKSLLNTGFTNALSEAIYNAKNAEETKEDLEAHTANMVKMIAEANEIQQSYAKFNTFVELCKTYAAESYSNVETADIRTTFTTAINTATNEGDAAASIEALNKVYNDLETARQEFINVAYPTPGNSFDFTFKITNAEVTSANGWANASGRINTSTSYTGAPDNAALDVGWWTNNIDINQELTGLPDGSYKLSAVTRSDADSQSYIYIKSGDDKVTADLAKYGTSNGALGNGWEEVTTPEFNVVSGTITIGAYMHNPGTTFAAADNFKLYRSYDATTAQNTVTSLVTEAESLTEKVMNADVTTALKAAINAADATSSNPFLLSGMIAELNTAITNAKASIATYEAIPAYITKANSIDESIAAEYQIAYDNRTLAKSAETVFQELEVATYNYVITNFTYPVELEANGWVSEGPVGSLTGQHYDGTNSSSYMEQSTSAWSSSAWEISYKYEKTLPAGEYIFKVAGRHANGEGTTMALTVSNIDDLENPVVLGSVNDFPKSDTGLGINKAGVTSFDAKDEAGFANNGAGRGWQWRYVKFELGSETTVEVAVTAAATTNHQWMSFCDATVQMTEETYMDANIGGLDAPTAAAQALVDTKPMGTDENNALKEALAMAKPTTGAALLAKIEALETAVANANAWRNTYNTEKGKLVAALERFEADYNDAENGALDYMNKDRWETAIAKAQAAAVAKDDLTSHAGLTTATTELTAALDAATVSVGEYADLKAAITEATTVTCANVGVNAFQKSQSAATTLNEQKATAQGIYDTATADGEGVTSETETLTNAISTFNSTPLNAPKENARYNIVIETTDDWGGHAATFIYDEENKAEDGYFNLQWLTEPNANYAQAFTFTACSELNTYTLSFVDHLGTTRYLATQKGAGYMDGENVSTRTDRLRITTDASKALKVQVIALNTDGLYQLKNTEHGQCIGYTTNHDLFTQTRNVSLREAEKANVTLTISEVGWATLILPFDAELPEGDVIRALTCAKAEGKVLTLVEAESLKANTPYLMNGAAGTYTFSGYGLATKDSYTEGMFVGTYVDYQTTADGETYVLQNQNNNLAFYLVQGTTLPWIRANRCYMTYAGGEAAPMFILSRGDETTGIETTVNGEQTTVIYDLMGRKVSTMEKGGIYIVNGKKVVVK